MELVFNNFISVLHLYAKIRLSSNKKHLLSTRVGISAYDASIINISKFINDIINNKSGADITQEINVLQGFVGLHYAYAFGSLVGINLMGQYTYGDLFQYGKSGGFGSGSVALDINLYRKTRIPLGLSVAYANAYFPDYSAAQFNNISLVNAKIAYTGSDRFINSIDAGAFTTPYQLGRIAEGSKVETRIINLAIKLLIYFN